MHTAPRKTHRDTERQRETLRGKANIPITRET